LDHRPTIGAQRLPNATDIYVSCVRIEQAAAKSDNRHQLVSPLRVGSYAHEPGMLVSVSLLT